MHITDKYVFLLLCELTGQKHIIEGHLEAEMILYHLFFNHSPVLTFLLKKVKGDLNLFQLFWKIAIM